MIYPRRRLPLLYYTAGLVDADGSVVLSKTEDEGRYVPALVITNCHLPTLEMVNDYLANGKGKISKKQRVSDDHEQCYSLNIRDSETLFKVLTRLTPYLIQKKKRSSVVLKYVETIIGNKGKKVSSPLREERMNIYKEWRSCRKLN